MSIQPAIGIDLGTTNTCIAVYQNGKVETIRGKNGRKTTPSFVSFTDKGRCFGLEAKNKMSGNLNNTVFGVKRLIGRKFDDTELQAELGSLPYKVIDVNGEPYIRVRYHGKKKNFRPQDISAMILSEMKMMAEKTLKQPISDVVITVPAAFNQLQRQATAEACQLAGLNVMQILNEPTAAAIAYTLKKKINDGDKILVYDFGGGTFDVTILEKQNSVFKVKCTQGDSHLGGDDIDITLSDYFIDEIRSEQGEDVNFSRKSVYRLRKACEKTKWELTSATEATIEVDDLFKDTCFESTISRKTFNELCDSFFYKTRQVVENCLENCGIAKKMIKCVVLVGGTTRIPRIKELLEEYFDGIHIETAIDAEDAVAQGAAINAAILKSEMYPELSITKVVDVVPLSLGIDTVGGLMSVIIERNTPIPVQKTKTFLTVKPQQTNFLIRIYEGQRTLFKYNKHLGSVRLDGIRPGPKETERMEVTFDVNANGILQVTARNPGSSKAPATISIDYNRSRLSADEVSQKLAEAEEFRLQDERERNRIGAQLKLRNHAELKKEQNSSNTNICRICDEVLNWITENEDESVEVYEDKLRQLTTSVG